MVEEIGLKVVLEADTSKLNGALKGIGSAGVGSAGAGAGAVAGLVGGATAVALPKIASMLQKASPALQGTFKILEQSFMILFRPLGDFLSMILRPLALLLLRFAVGMLKWLKGQKQPEAEALAESGDAEGLNELISGKLEEGLDPSDLLKTSRDIGIGWLRGILPDEADFLADITKVFTKIFIDLPLEVLKSLGDIAGGILAWGEEIGAGLAEDFNAWWEESGLKDFFTGISTAFEQLIEGDFDGVIKGVGEFFNKVNAEVKKITGLDIAKTFNDFKDKFVKIGEDAKQWIDENIIAPLASILSPLLDGVKGLVNAVIDLVNGVIQGINSMISSIASFTITTMFGQLRPFAFLQGWGLPEIPRLAEGGDITSSGLAYLHEGERVVPAGVSHSNSVGNITINITGGNYNERELADRVSRELMLKLNARWRV